MADTKEEHAGRIQDCYMRLCDVLDLWSLSFGSLFYHLSRSSSSRGRRRISIRTAVAATSKQIKIMSSDNGDHAKKRRVDSGVGALSVRQVGRENGSEHQQLMSMMNKLLDQNRLQTATMKNIQEEMKVMRGEMNGMSEEVKLLRENYPKMDILIRATKKSLKKEMVDGIDHVDDRISDVWDKLNYHEVMLESQKWEYSVPYPYDTFDGSPEKGFLDTLKENTCNMRYGKGCGSVEIDGLNLDYDEDFLPHWKEFAKALQEYQYFLMSRLGQHDTAFQLRDVQLPKPLLDLLSDALESTHFTSLNLQRNHFGRDGIEFALNYLRNNPELVEFHLIGNPLNNDEVIELCEIITDHPKLDKLELDECFGEGINGHEMLCSIMTAGREILTSIDLSSNHISTRGSTFISDFLAANPILETLILIDNNLNNIDATSIASALKRNTNLRFLNIDDNQNITEEEGWDALRKAEFDPTSLNSAAVSNHTCYIDGASEFNYKRFEPKALRQKKIYNVLSERNRECSNVQHFGDLPVEILPEMLASVEQYSDYHVGESALARHDEDVSSLSMVYEITRFWDKSVSLFEALSIN